MHFAAQNPDRAMAQIKAADISALPEYAIQGMSDEEKALVSNFSIGPDTDLDGLTDLLEALIGTDPTLIDTDTDGLPDGLEYFAGLDPLVNDAADDLDNDQLSNIDEYNLGTDLANPDTDGDGLQDGAEVNTYSSDPFLEDSDSDGLTDGQEVNDFNTDPTLADTDSDGMSDLYEIDNSLDPLIDDSGADPDGDGLTNIEEQTSSTNPNNADTDLDELNDGEEVNVYLTNPLEADTDGGGDPDGFEVSNGSDPLNPNDDVSVSLPNTLIDGDGNEWFIIQNGTAQESVSDEISTLPYSTVNQLQVNGQFYTNNFLSSVLTEDAKRELVFPEQQLNDNPNLSISRKVFVSETDGFIRYLELITNDGLSVESINLRFSSNLQLGLDIVATSSGDEVIDSQDTSVVLTNPNTLGGVNSYAQLWGNEFSPLQPASVSGSINNINIEYDFEIQPNDSKLIMHFAAVNSDPVILSNVVEQYELLTPTMLEGMSAEEIDNVLNFIEGTDTDNDGLVDSIEQEIGTSITNPDTDADGLNDFYVLMMDLK